MLQYTMPQCPESLFTVVGSRDSDSIRYKAARQIAKAVNDGCLNIIIPEGFSTNQLIEITKKDLMAENEDKIINAVKVISKLSVAKQRIQVLHEQALVSRRRIDDLFSVRVLAKQDFDDIKQSLRIIEDFAKANLAYKEALLEAENARSILDDALKITEE